MRTSAHSVNKNSITGDAAQQLAKVVLEHPSITDFGGIPIKALRDNSVTELNIQDRGVGHPGGLVLSHLLPAATAVTSCK